MSDYRFDRTAFKMQTFDETDKASLFDKNVSYAERLRQVYYLISQAYGFSMSNEPRLDRTYHSSPKKQRAVIRTWMILRNSLRVNNFEGTSHKMIFIGQAGRRQL